MQGSSLLIKKFRVWRTGGRDSINQEGDGEGVCLATLSSGGHVCIASYFMVFGH